MIVIMQFKYAVDVFCYAVDMFCCAVDVVCYTIDLFFNIHFSKFCCLVGHIWWVMRPQSSCAKTSSYIDICLP
jgi:hypothetical protein